MHAVDLVIVLGWIAFWGYWLVSATTMKPGRSRWGQAIGIRLVIVVIVVGLGRVGVLHGHEVHDPTLAGVGLVLFLIGLALAFWARVHIGRNWGTPMTEKIDPELVTTGPYRWIRNPIYTGVILAGVGTAVAVSPFWLILVAIVGTYFVYSAVMEQRYMTTRFPDTYPAYRDSTKMLIPYVF